MQRRIRTTTRGFTLVELMVSMGIGLLLLGVALTMFREAVNATWVTSQKSEMQQDFRAAGNLIARDISMAGSGSLGQSGLASNSVGLPFGTGTLPVYPCSSTTCNYVKGASVAYPTVTGSPYLYSIVPGYNLGVTVNATEGPTDIISIAYADANLALNCYSVTVTSATTALFQLPIVLPSTCILPTGVAAPQPLNDPIIGLQAGDYILFGQAAAAVVSTVATTAVTNGALYSAAYNVAFNVGDPGHINQPTATTGSLKQLFVAGTLVSAARLLLITYYLDFSPVDGVTPRLMRVQSGKPPSPVAENVSYLKFSYDVDNNGVITANQTSLPAGITPNMITKVNIVHMTIRSQMRGTAGYQGLDLQTSVSARNLTMGQEYPISGSAY
jgi:prepilin-type N-terminal cleavage/methylation domain-containing protein